MAEELAQTAFYSYNLQNYTPLEIGDLIYALEPRDLPMSTGMGSDGVPVMSRQPVGNTKWYWQEAEAPLPRSTLNESGFDDTETDLTLPTGHAVRFAVGDTIRLENETMKVTAVDTSTEVLTVTRGTLGTSAAAHLTGTEVIGVGTTLPEGDIGSATYKDRDQLYNYTQIWSAKMTVSRTEQGIKKYGVPNELAYQTVRRLQHLMLGFEQSALYGTRYEDSATRVRSTGGMFGMITTNVNSTDDWLTVGSIEEQLQNQYNYGGGSTHLMAQPKNFGALNNAEGNERVTSVDITDPRRGRIRAQVVMTEYGPVELVRNRWARSADAVLYTPSRFIYREFQPLVTTPLAKTDDTDSFMMVMEGGFQLTGEVHASKWTGLDATAAFPSTLV